MTEKRENKTVKEMQVQKKKDRYSRTDLNKSNYEKF